MANDFYIHRGTTSFAIADATKTITNGVEYTLQRGTPSASYAFCKIVSSNNAGNRGATDGNTNPDNATFTISGTITTSQTFTRAASAIAATVEWEIIEYIGSASGANEFIVRDTAEVSTTSTSDTVDSNTITGVVSDAKMLPWITGQRSTTNASNTASDANFIATWNNATDTITFTRRRSQNFVGTISYAAIEFTGSNWTVQRIPHSYTTAATKEDESITDVGDTTRAFLHLQQNFNNDNVMSQGHEVWLSATNVVSFRLATGATTATTTSVAWVVSNSQTSGPMVSRYYGTYTTATNGNESKAVTAVAATNNTSLEGCCATNPQNTASFPTNVSNFKLTSTTTVQEFRARAVNTQSYFFSTVEWPASPAAGLTTEYVAPCVGQSYSPMIGRRYV